MSGTIARRRLLLLAPLGVAAAAGAAAFALLLKLGQGSYDPHAVPSMLIGKPLPSFALPGLGEGPGFSSGDVVAAGRPVLLNFFASWCVPCVEEAPTLSALRARGAALWGIAYKDKPSATENFLRENGDPYLRIARDEPGRAAIDFGLYGVPETYLVDRTGVVRSRWVGGITEDIVAHEIMPMLKTYA